ncbi:MAG: hypothetical protein WC211_02030 [Dehalococcoidia bacterium]
MRPRLPAQHLRRIVALMAVAALFAACGQDPAPARPAAQAGYRLERGERFAFTMEVPSEWESLRGRTIEGARVQLAGSEFIADIAVNREQTSDRSIEAARDALNGYLAATGLAAVRNEAVSFGGLPGWSWEFAAQPAQGPQPRREARQQVILLDAARGGQWLITYTWANPDAERRYRPAFEHALSTFRPGQ